MPPQLVQQDDTGSFVWLADQSDGVARKAIIQAEGVGTGGLVEIKNGLTMTSRLIVAGRDGLQDGQRIQITGEDFSLSPSIPNQQEESTRSPF